MFLLFGIFVWVANILFERKKDYKYAFSEFAKGLHEETNVHLKNLSPLMKLMLPFTTKVFERVRDDSKERKLEKRLRDGAMSHVTPQEFVVTKVLYALAFTSIFLMTYLLSNNVIFLALTVLGVLTYFYPDLQLNRRIAMVENQKKIELPEYLIPLGLLMFSNTPYNAVRTSVEHAGPYLKPHVERLIADLEMYPGSSRPFDTFNENIGIMQAQIFITALQQSFTTDPVKSREIIEDQTEMMRKMREENYLALIARKPLEMNKYNVVAIFCMLIIPLTIVVIQVLGTMGG